MLLLPVAPGPLQRLGLALPQPLQDGGGPCEAGGGVADGQGAAVLARGGVVVLAALSNLCAAVLQGVPKTLGVLPFSQN